MIKIEDEIDHKRQPKENRQFLKDADSFLYSRWLEARKALTDKKFMNNCLKPWKIPTSIDSTIDTIKLIFILLMVIPIIAMGFILKFY